MKFKKGIYCGGVSFLIAGIFANVLAYFFIFIGIMGVTVPITFKDINILIASGTIPLFVVYGMLLGIVYQVVRPVIPGAGLKKGIYYALFAWLLSDVVAKAAILGVWKASMGAPEYLFSFNLITISLPTKILFGLILETLWRRGQTEILPRIDGHESAS